MRAYPWAAASGRAMALAGVVLLAPVTRLPAQDAAERASDAATRQYATAAALQNREQYELAAEEWGKFLSAHPRDERVDHARHYLGLCHLQLEQFEQAAAALAKVLADHPQSPLVEPSYIYLGLAQYNQARGGGDAALFAKADATLRALLEKYPRSKHAAQATFYRGEALYALGKKAEAVRQYEQLVRQFPNDPQLADALYALGVAQEELGQASAAESSYGALLAKFPDHALAGEVTLRRGDVLAAQQKHDDAEKLFAAAAARPNFALADQAILRHAASVARRGDHKSAAELYASLPRRFPESKLVADAQLAAGRSLYLADQPAAAREQLSPLTNGAGAPAAEAAHWLARCWLKEKRPDQALAAAEAGLAKSDKTPWAVALALDRADALFELPDRAAEAGKLYASIARDHPDDPAASQALYMAGFAALGAKQFEPALEYAAEFRRRYPNDELRADVDFVAAECRLLSGQYPQATQEYAALLAAHSRHRDAESWQVRRGLALYLDKKYADAIAALEPVAAKLANKPLAAEAYYLLGAAYNELGQAAAAVKALDASRVADPRWKQADDTLLALAVALERSGDARAAQARLEELIRAFPESPALERAHYRLGELAYAAGDLDAAARQYRIVADRWPQGSLRRHAAYGLAWTDISRQDYQAAAKALDALLADDGVGDLAPKARYARALARQQLKQYDAAIDDLQVFLKSSPAGAEQSEARYLLGACLASAGRAAEASAALDSLLRDDPQYAGTDKALYELAWALDAQKKRAEAADAFARLARDRGDSPFAAEALYYVGEQQYDAQRFAEAARSYYQAMQKAGRGALGEKASHKLGWAYFRQDEFDRARQTFEHQRATYPEGPLVSDAAFMLAECAFKLGKFEQALAAYEQVKDPAGKDFGVLAQLHAGQAAAQLKQWERSQEILDRAARQFAESGYLPELLYERGWALQNLGRLDEAVALYEDVTSKTDAEVAARARFMVGEVLFQKKDHAGAVRNYFKAAFGYAYPRWQAAAHYEAGRCFEVLQKPDQARKSYQEVVDHHPMSEQAELARQRLAALGGSPSAGK